MVKYLFKTFEDWKRFSSFLVENHNYMYLSVSSLIVLDPLKSSVSETNIFKVEFNSFGATIQNNGTVLALVGGDLDLADSLIEEFNQLNIGSDDAIRLDDNPLLGKYKQVLEDMSGFLKSQEEALKNMFN